MRLPWSKPKPNQLELLDADPELPREPSGFAARQHERSPAAPRSSKPAADRDAANAGRPLLVPLDRLSEDPNNPRTEFPEAEIDELAESIRQHGVLQPLVVCPADAVGRYRIHHGAKRSRAARRAGLSEVPVVVRDASADPYAQAAENQKRQGLTPLDLARLIRRQADAGDSNAKIGTRLGIDQTTIAHHLALLELPPAIDEALKSGRCTSPKTLYELTKLHQAQPEEAKTLLSGDADITRTAVAAARASTVTEHRSKKTAASMLTQANSACARLEAALAGVESRKVELSEPDLSALRQRLASLARRIA